MVVLVVVCLDVRSDEEEQLTGRDTFDTSTTG